MIGFYFNAAKGLILMRGVSLLLPTRFVKSRWNGQYRITYFSLHVGFRVELRLHYSRSGKSCLRMLQTERRGKWNQNMARFLTYKQKLSSSLNPE